jgi:hypothetical protein
LSLNAKTRKKSRSGSSAGVVSVNWPAIQRAIGRNSSSAGGPTWCFDTRGKAFLFFLSRFFFGGSPHFDTQLQSIALRNLKFRVSYPRGVERRTITYSRGLRNHGEFQVSQPMPLSRLYCPSESPLYGWKAGAECGPSCRCKISHAGCPSAPATTAALKKWRYELRVER